MILHNKKSHSGSKRYDLVKNIRAVSSNIHKTTEPVKLSQEQIDEIVRCLSGRAHQAKRFVQHAGQNPDATTDSCNKAVLSANLSDLAIKYNPYLRDMGYELRCRLPERLIKNRMGETTMIHLWGLYTLGGSHA